MTLATAKNGETVLVIGIKDNNVIDSQEGLRLSDMGVVKGQKIRIIKRAPLGDPMQVELLGYQLCLRKEQAVCVEVESYDSEV